MEKARAMAVTGYGVPHRLPAPLRVTLMRHHPSPSLPAPCHPVCVCVCVTMATQLILGIGISAVIIIQSLVFNPQWRH